MKITFTPGQTVGQADRMLYGHFLEHFHRQIYGGIYDPESRFSDEDGFRTDVLEALKRITPPIIRWPGGCYVSAYDWKKGVGKTRVPAFDKAWRVEESHKFGTDEFIKLCRKLGCEPYICTNAGTGSAEDMSDWVEYCNLESMGQYAKRRIENGYKEPHNVKYWSIGNENWGGHEIGAKDQEEWGRFVRESAKMMLRVDPTLELSAAALDNLDWNLHLLRDAGAYLDWVSVHSYWDFPGDGEAKPSQDYETVMLHTGEGISGVIDRVRAHLTALGLEKKIKVAYDEWNLRAWYHPNLMDIWNRETKRHEDRKFYENEVIGRRNANDKNEIYTMADAVFSASFLNTCLRNCDLVKMACFSPVVNTRGAIFTHKDGIVLRPQYFVFELYTRYMLDTVLNIWTEDVPKLKGAIGNIEKTVDAIDVVVTHKDGKYAVSAVNKKAEKEEKLILSMIGSHASEMRIHTLNGNSKDSYNDIGRTEVGIESTGWMPLKEEIMLQAHSVNVIEIR